MSKRARKKKGRLATAPSGSWVQITWRTLFTQEQAGALSNNSSHRKFLSACCNVPR